MNVDYTAMDGIYVEYWEYGYNLQNRMESVRKNGQVTAQYSYDYSGKRIRSEREGTVLHFVYGLGGELVYQTDVTSAEGEIYIHALGRVMAQVVGGELSYYHYDNLGSTVLMTDDVGKRVFAQDYEPFGQTLYVEQIQQPGFSFTGQREDAGIGLYYYNARYYDPELGRFSREDDYPGDDLLPLSQHLYLYAFGNPLRYVDPTGHMNVEGVGGGGPIQEAENIKRQAELRENESEEAVIVFVLQTEPQMSLINKGVELVFPGSWERGQKAFDSPYNFINWISWGTADTVKGALFPEKPLSLQHWYDSACVALMVAPHIRNVALSGSVSTRTVPTSVVREATEETVERAQVQINRIVGTEFEVYVEGTRLKGIARSGQLELQVPYKVTGGRMVKPDYSIYDLGDYLAAIADAKTGNFIPFDKQAIGFLEVASRTKSKTLIYFTPAGDTVIADELLDRALEMGVKVIQKGVF